MPLVGTALASAASAAPRSAFLWRRSGRLDPRRFGRLVRAPDAVAPAAVALPVERGRSLASGLRLFAVTFLAGFLFVSVLLA